MIAILWLIFPRNVETRGKKSLSSSVYNVCRISSSFDFWKYQVHLTKEFKGLNYPHTPIQANHIVNIHKLFSMVPRLMCVAEPFGIGMEENFKDKLFTRTSVIQGYGGDDFI